MSRRSEWVARWLLACGAVAGLLYAGWWYLCESVIYASLGYEVEAEFTELPPGDTALEAWLTQQPGVFRATVARPGPGGNLRVLLLMEQNLHRKPPFPDLDGACARFGYLGQVVRFHDSQRRVSLKPRVNTADNGFAARCHFGWQPRAPVPTSCAAHLQCQNEAH